MFKFFNLSAFIDICIQFGTQAVVKVEMKVNLISTNMVGEFVKWTNSPLRLLKYGLICLFEFGKDGGAAFDKTLPHPGSSWDD